MFLGVFLSGSVTVTLALRIAIGLSPLHSPPLGFFNIKDPTYTRIGFLGNGLLAGQMPLQRTPCPTARWMGLRVRFLEFIGFGAV